MESSRTTGGICSTRGRGSSAHASSIVAFLRSGVRVCTHVVCACAWLRWRTGKEPNKKADLLLTPNWSWKRYSVLTFIAFAVHQAGVVCVHDIGCTLFCDFFGKVWGAALYTGYESAGLGMCTCAMCECGCVRAHMHARRV